ncbi:TonB-dependent receptor [Parabacteroides distasonis]|nr:TonB-dependent receptor [Parabacteroides distasonis]
MRISIWVPEQFQTLLRRIGNVGPMNSYFLRFAYTFKDRYSATVTGRYDGSSKFGDNNKYAFFPSAGLAWNITQEDFMGDQNTISNLKLHTSYGLTGNSEIGVYKSSWLRSLAVHYC